MVEDGPLRFGDSRCFLQLGVSENGLGAYTPLPFPPVLGPGSPGLGPLDGHEMKPRESHKAQATSLAS